MPSTGADHARSIASYIRAGVFATSALNSAVSFASGCGEFSPAAICAMAGTISVPAAL